MELIQVFAVIISFSLTVIGLLQFTISVVKNSATKNDQTYTELEKERRANLSLQQEVARLEIELSKLRSQYQELEIRFKKLVLVARYMKRELDLLKAAPESEK